MKITYILNGMFNSAGMERVVSNKAQFLTSRGHRITIITANQAGKPYFYRVPDSVIKIDFGLDSFEYDGKPIVVKVFSFLKKEKAFKKKLGKFLKDFPQDVVVTLEDKFIPMLVQLAPEGTVLVAENHFNQFAFKQLGKSVNRNFVQRIVYGLRSKYVQYCYHGRLDAYVLLTHEDYEYRSGNKRNVYVIPNSTMYDKSKVAALNNKVVMTVGRLTYQKGYERLLESWSLVHKVYPEWSLQLYGDGEDRLKLIELCKKYCIDNSVVFFSPTPQIQERLLDASIYVMTSRFEGLPMTLIEAMSLGLPLVSFDCKTGPKDVIKNGYNGFLIHEGDIKSLAEYLMKLMKDEDLRLKMGHNSKIEGEKYSHEHIAELWENLFNNLIARKK